MWKAYPRHSVNLSPGCYAAAARALFTGGVLEGPAVDRFETEFSRFVGTEHALGVSSGRAALYLAFQSLGLAEGDEIIMPAYTFHIVPLVIRACGLKPVFVDVLPDSYNIDVARIAEHLTDRTRAILATHMYGQPCDLDPILKLAEEHGLKVVEDCAHALGAEYKGRKVGSFGDLAAFTFAMAKNMPCFGGGMLTTSDPELYATLRQQVHAPSPARRKGLWKEVASSTANYVATRPAVFSLLVYPLMRAAAALRSSFFDTEPGQETVSPDAVQTTFATRLTNLQSAVGLHQLTRIDQINAKVNRNALLYNEGLKDCPGIKVPQVEEGRTHTFLYYRIEVERRERLRKKLLPHGIDTTADDMSNCLTLPPFRNDQADIPVASRLPLHVLEVPNNQNLSDDDVRYLAQTIRKEAAKL